MTIYRPLHVTQGQLDSWRDKWQKQLGLTDWKVTVTMVPAKALQPNLGDINWDNDQLTAVIRVLRPEYYPHEGPWVLTDMEYTVLHELIHLELHGLEGDPSTVERAVNGLGDALFFPKTKILYSQEGH